MTLKESIYTAIQEFGKDIITESRFVNILADYDAFAESRQMRMVVKEMIEQGFTKRILDVDTSAVNVDETINALVYEALNLFPFRENLISSFLSTVVRCLVVEEDNLVGKQLILNAQVLPLKETSLEYFEISEDGKTLIEANGNLSGKVVIPAGIEVIGDCAFLENDSITEVYFPEGIKKIGTSAFDSCTKLRNIQLPSSLEIIDDSAFVGNECLTEVLIPNGVKKLGDAAFADCTNLVIVHLPESLEEIGSYCFADCYKLTNILIPKNVKTIGHGLSYSDAVVDPCNNYLKSVEGAILSKDGKVLYSVPGNRKNYTVPEGVVDLPMETFRDTKILEFVSLPKSLRHIYDHTFSYCDNLQHVEFQEGLETVHSNAFSGCPSLKEIVLPESVKTLGDSLFLSSGVKKIIFKSLKPESIEFKRTYWEDDIDMDEDSDAQWGYLPDTVFYVPLAAYEKYIQLKQFKDVNMLFYDKFIPLGENPQSLIDKSLMGFKSKEDFCHIGDIILGKTTCAEAKRLGHSVEKHGYSVSRCFDGKHGVFWDHNGKGRFDSFYYTLTDGRLPAQWEECGMYHDLSYDSFISLFRDWGFIFKIHKVPVVERWKDRECLAANFEAISYDDSVIFNLEFSYGNENGEGAATSSPNSLYSIIVDVK